MRKIANHALVVRRMQTAAPFSCHASHSVFDPRSKRYRDVHDAISLLLALCATSRSAPRIPSRQGGAASR